MHWLYDPQVSAIMLEDENMSDAQRAATLRAVSERMMSDLYKYSYFTRLFVGEQALQVVAVTEYHLELTPDKRLQLDFPLSLAKPQPLAGKQLDINLVDPAGTAILLYRAVEDISIGPTKSACAVEIEAHPNFAHGEPAQTVHLQCR